MAIKDERRGVTVGKVDKFMRLIMGGVSDSNIPFSALCNLLNRLGFKERIRGDHHIFTRTDIEEIINLQPTGSKAKAYQIKQIRNICIKYRMGE